MFAVPHDVLTNLFGLLAFIADPTVRLFATLGLYALIPLPVLFLLRRWSIEQAFRVVSLGASFRRIWDGQRRQPRRAVGSALRLAEETRTNPLTAVLCGLAATALMLWWWLGALLGWADADFRHGLGQGRPVMFGVPLSPVRWAVDTNHAVLLVLLAVMTLVPVLAGLRVCLVARRFARRRGRPVRPWFADRRFLVGLSAGLILEIWYDPLLWQRVTLLAGLLTEVLLTAAILSSARLVQPPVPLWVQVLPRGRGRQRPARPGPQSEVPPRPLPGPWPSPEPVAGPWPSPAPATRVRTTVVAEERRAPLTTRMATSYRQFLGGTDARTAQLAAPPGAGLAAERSVRLPTGTDSWQSCAPELAPLSERDRRRIGPYSLRGRLGIGGMSVVYAGVHRPSGRPVAIKIMRDLLDDTGGQARLLREMEALSAATGPHSVRILTVGHDGDDHFLVMERLFGPNLADFVVRCGPLREPEALTHLAGVLAAGLADFHARGVTHRDLKPANVVLTDAGPVIVDLGIARLADATATVPGSQAFATMGYVAPETILGKATLASADVWAWGCCVTFAASGQRLFPGEAWEPTTYAILNGQRNPAALDALRRVSDPLADTVLAATAVDPAERPPTGAALLALLPHGTRWPSPSHALGR